MNNVEKKSYTFKNVNFDDGTTEKIIVEIELTHKPEGDVFTAHGEIYDGNDLESCGQVLDRLYYLSDLKNDNLFIEIYDLWKNYHCNDLHAGTPEQEKCLRESKWEGVRASDYKEQCKYLEENGLLTVNHNGKPYKYGTGWLFEAIPEKDLERIRRLL